MSDRSTQLGLENTNEVKINPATEEKQDATNILLSKLVGFEIPTYDYIALTYVASGDGVGEIEMAISH